jgi:hypothetical protein
VSNTATSALTNTKSIINNILPTLATTSSLKATVGNYQPLDTTNTLSILPKTVLSSNPYFAGFPLDQPAWTIQNSAAYTNISDNTPSQYLTFPSTSAILSYSIYPNTYPGQSCLLSFSMQGFSTSTITVSFRLLGSGTVIASNTFNNISTTSYTNYSIPFTSPTDEFYLQLSGTTGILKARNWAVIKGTSTNAQIRGNVNVPMVILPQVIYFMVHPHYH